MKYSLLDDICCPTCHGRLQLERPSSDGGEVVEGTLRCTQCQEEYVIRKRIPNLISSSHVELHKLTEMDGWVKLWEKKGMFEYPAPEASFRLPYLGGDGIWKDVSRMFDMAMQEMNLSGSEEVLDVGAGQGWACKYFAAKGCKVMAVDIVADESYGLGRSWAIMEQAGVYFSPMLGDGENLPFPDAKFDIVFFFGALHHFKDIDRVLGQVMRVLKPGGRIIAAGEPSISVFDKEATIQDSLEETHFGIVECRPKSFQFERAFTRAGFKHVKIDTYETYDAPPQMIYGWIRTVRSKRTKAVRPRYKPIVWLALTAALLLPPRAAAKLTLYLHGGNLILTGSK